MAGCTVCKLGSRRRRSIGQTESKLTPKSAAALGILALGGILLWKMFGPEREKQPPPVVDLPPGELPANWNPKPVADLLYKVLSGPAMTELQIAARAAALKIYLDLPAPQFVDVYNYFNQNYGGGDTLKKWIKDEYGLGILGDQLIVRFNSFEPPLKGMNGWLTTPGINPANQFFNWNYLNWQDQYKKVVNDLNTDLDIIASS